MMEWEYKVVRGVSDSFCKFGVLGAKRLNILGKKGWELVAVYRHSRDQRYIFKRSKAVLVTGSPSRN